MSLKFGVYMSALIERMFGHVVAPIYRILIVTNVLQHEYTITSRLTIIMLITSLLDD